MIDGSEVYEHGVYYIKYDENKVPQTVMSSPGLQVSTRSSFNNTLDEMDKTINIQKRGKDGVPTKRSVGWCRRLASVHALAI